MAESVQQPVTGLPNWIAAVAVAVLLTLGLLMPWNIHFGWGISETLGWAFVILIVATVLSLAALVVDQSMPRLLVAAPYLILVATFTLFTEVISVRYGGSGVVSPGVGPGAWFGMAGALLAARPWSAADDHSRAARLCRVIGWSSIVLATWATLFNLYFRTRFVLHGIGGEASLQNLTTAVGALLYGGVALAPVLVVGRWIIAGRPGSQLANALLGGATLAAGGLVWFLPVGRLVDGFHGIAQNTGTVSVGYEGYLAWIAVAAISAPPVLRRLRDESSAEQWRTATRSGLALIAVWCGGKAVLRATDVGLAYVLHLPTLPYNATMLMAFDLLSAVLAVWLFINSRTGGAPQIVTVPLLGVLVVLTVCRLILGVALVPRVTPLNPGTVNPVFGNYLAQQITSTFDVTLCILGLILLVGAFGLGARNPNRLAAPRPVIRTAAVPGRAAVASSVPVPVPGPDLVRVPVPAPATAPPTAAPDRVVDVLAQSTQRFAAGTTYGGPPAAREADNRS